MPGHGWGLTPSGATPGGRDPGPAREPHILLVCVLGCALVYWLWLGIAHRSVTTDPAISILVARSILENGYPLLPSGYVYHRGALAHYVLAGSIAAFGLNDFSIVLPSVLMALGSLVLVYLIARDVLGDRSMGVVAAVALIAVQQQSYYATSPRMYIYLQFFTLLAVYSGWKGHIEESYRFRLVAILAVVGAMLSHQQGGSLAVALPLGVLATGFYTNGPKGAIGELKRLGSFAVLLMLYVPLVVSGPLPGSMPRIALRGGVGDGGSLSGLNLDPLRWLSQINWLEHTVPLGITLLPALVALVYGAVRNRGSETSRGSLYLTAVFALWALGVFGFIRISGERFWIGVAPIYVLLLLASIQMVVGRPLFRLRAWAWVSQGAPTRMVRFAVAGWGTVVILGMSLYYGPMGYAEVLRTGYGVPCLPKDLRCSSALESEFEELSRLVGPDDLVISTDPMVTSYYLRDVHGWFVQQREGDTHAAFDSPSDEYLGIPLIDTTDELTALSRSAQRAWVVMYTGPQRDLSDERLSVLDQTYTLFRRSTHLTIYVNSAAGLPKAP